MTDSSMIAWTAGLLEGEACFGMYPDKRSNYIACRIHVESIDLDVLERLKSHFGGRIHENNAPSKPKHYKRSWRWQLSKQQDVYTLLCVIYNYMSNRRKKKIDDMLEYLSEKIA